MPVPTAVPPRGSSATRGRVDCEPLDPESDLSGISAELLAEGHRRRVHQVGAAGLDDLGELRRPWPRAPRPRWSSAGIRSWVIAAVAATWIEVGNVSLLDWLALTWSLGWTSRPERCDWRAMRSPRWCSCCSTCRSRSGRCRSGTASSCAPSATSSGGVVDRRRPWRCRARRAQRWPVAAAALISASARMWADSSALAGDREVLDRALGLGAPQRVARHPDLAHRVVLDPELGRRRQSCGSTLPTASAQSVGFCAAS